MPESSAQAFLRCLLPFLFSLLPFLSSLLQLMEGLPGFRPFCCTVQREGKNWFRQHLTLSCCNPACRLRSLAAAG